MTTTEEPRVWRQKWPAHDTGLQAWFGGQPIYRVCEGSNHTIGQHNNPGAEPPRLRTGQKLTCSRCHMDFPQDACRPVNALLRAGLDLPDWVRAEAEKQPDWALIPPVHEVLVTTEHQASEQLRKLAVSLGLDPRDDRRALHVIADAAHAEGFQRDRSVAGRVAAGLAGLAILMAEQGAPSAVDAVRRFATFAPETMPEVVRADNQHLTPEELRGLPLISEAYLYPLLGKEDARTVLALFRAIGEAVGA